MLFIQLRHVHIPPILKRSPTSLNLDALPAIMQIIQDMQDLACRTCASAPGLPLAYTMQVSMFKFSSPNS